MTLRRHGGLFAGIIIMLVMAAASPIFGGEIRIWPTAVVGNDTVALGDVAQIRGFSPGESERLRSLVVHGSPRPGGEILVRVAALLDALSEEGVNLGEVQVFGSSRCRVSRHRSPRTLRKSGVAVRSKRPLHRRNRRPETTEPNNLSPSHRSLESVLRDYVAARIPHDDANLEISFSPTSQRLLALRSPEYQFTIRGNRRGKMGLVSYQVNVQQAGRVIQSASIATEVLLVKDVVVARRPINQGQTITGRDLKLEERRFSRLDTVGLTDLSASIGLQSRRFFKPGDMLDARSLQARPLVRRGDFVKILMRGEGLEIRTSGKAQASGALGDLIPVRRDGAKRKQDLIDAVVIGPGLVSYRGMNQVVRR